MKKPGKRYDSWSSQALVDRKGYETQLEDRKRCKRWLELGNSSLHRSTGPCLCENSSGYCIHLLKIKHLLKKHCWKQNILFFPADANTFSFLPSLAGLPASGKGRAARSMKPNTGACFRSLLFCALSEVQFTTKWRWLLPEKLFSKESWPEESLFNWRFTQQQLEHVCCGLFAFLQVSWQNFSKVFTIVSH